MKISRRVFLGSVIAGGTVAVAGHFSLKYQRHVQAAVRRRLNFLQHDQSGLQRFAKDFTSRYRKDRTRVAAIGGVAFLEAGLGRYNPLHERLMTFDEFVCDCYLRGSDFFENAQDETRTIHYLAFPDPYLVPCRHPFMRIAGDITETA